MPKIIFPKTAPETLVPVIPFDIVAYLGEGMFAIISPNTGMTRSAELPENPQPWCPAYFPCDIESGQMIHLFQFKAAVLTKEDGKWYYSRRKDGLNRQPLAPNTVFEIMATDHFPDSDWDREDN